MSGSYSIEFPAADHSELCCAAWSRWRCRVGGSILAEVGVNMLGEETNTTEIYLRRTKTTTTTTTTMMMTRRTATVSL